MNATREDLRRVLCEYEGAVQEAQEGGDEEEAKLEEARKCLLDILQQAKVQLPES